MFYNKYIFVSIVYLSSSALYAKEKKKNTLDVTLDSIVVNGIKPSLDSSMNAKKNNTAIIDLITAEEINSFPDKNIAESLSRLPGVAITRLFGEGQGLNIRGLPSSYNETKLNGQSLGTAQWFSLNQAERTFNYEMLSSEMIERATVIKSSQADLDEGSLGATVLLETRKPLHLKKNTFELSLDTQYTDMAKKVDPSGSFSYSWKNDDETLGAFFATSIQNRTVRREATEVFGYLDPFDNNLDESLLAPKDSNNRGIVPVAMGSALFQQKRERIGTNTTIEWKPNDVWSTTLNYFFTKLNASNQNQNFIAFPSKGLYNTKNPLNGLVNNGVVTQLDVEPSSLEFDNIYRDGSKMQTNSLSLKSQYNTSLGSLNAQVGSTTAKGINNDDLYIFTPKSTIKNTNYIFHNDASGPSIDYGNNDLLINPADSMALSRVVYIRTKTEDKEHYFQLDYNQYVDWEMFNEIKIGAKYRIRDFSQNRSRDKLTNAGENGLGDASIYQDGTYTVNHTTSQGPLTTYNVDRARMEEAFLNLPDCTHTDGLVPCRKHTFLKRASYNINEQINSLYLMGNFEGESYSGNIGVRYTKTHTISNAYNLNTNTQEPISDISTYDEFLPSFNFRYEVSDDLIFHLSAAKVMTRPAPYQLTSAVTLRHDLSIGSGGNPKLKPITATQYDIDTEWYYGKQSYVSMSIFYKDINNLIFNSSQEETINGINYKYLTRPRNGPNTSLHGLEVNLQHNLTENIGILANYTYTDLKNVTLHDMKNNQIFIHSITLPFSSKNIYNLSIYYDDKTWSGKLSYNFRSKFFLRSVGVGQLWNKPLSQLDGRFSYKVNNHWSLHAEALNMTNEKIEEYYLSPSGASLKASQYQNGRRFYVGVHYSY